MRILVTGAKGQLGSEIKRFESDFKEYQFDFHDIDTIDLLNKSDLERYFQSQKPDFVINCAAYTAVDKAEEDTDGATKGNHEIVTNLTEQCKLTGAYLIQVSTDYVFDGKNYRPYIETDSENPQGIYGLTKLEGEKSALSYNKAIVIRTSWLYSSFGNNFVKTMIKLGKERDQLNVIFDQIGTPTYAFDLAQYIMHIINLTSQKEDAFKSGIYHFSNEGACSWYDFAIEIIKLNNIQCEVFPIETKDYPTPAKRPHYSVLNKSKIKINFNRTIPHWKDGLRRCLDKLNTQ